MRKDMPVVNKKADCRDRFLDNLLNVKDIRENKDPFELHYCTFCVWFFLCIGNTFVYKSLSNYLRLIKTPMKRSVPPLPSQTVNPAAAASSLATVTAVMCSRPRGRAC